LKVVHWTVDKNFTLKPIIIRNGYRGDGLREKPLGGLWTSPYHSKYSWKHWCKAENSHNSLKGYTRILITITEDNMLIIDKEEDLKKFPMIQPPNPSYPYHYINFEKLKEDGIDSIYLTEEGVWETRFSHPISFYPWDCETVLIMNERCITDWRVLR